MKTNNTKGIISLVVGIISIIAVIMPYFGLPLSILAVIFANQQENKYANGIATGGKVTGIIGIVLNSLMLLFVILILLVASAM